jgi:tetratricopeptide (TPR) repeat protein
MAKVSLRVYNREIEGMIEGGLLDESVAHCQHILRTFPMHIETYRLLGKGFLEARRYTDAADIFQRVLMAVPDDFVAHVGMSIIRDDEGKLDDAIWHMERAFEDQPSNSAIQGELRRLYGRRDGIEPPKIRLSRDALANMYSQGELFNQAIAEIRAVLAEDPNRPDLQVMLARAYYRAGQKVEAAEMAANLLKKYTYCLDALRILVDVLPETARAENTQVYRLRLRMLDPYSGSVTGSAFSNDQVPDAAVNLERLEYKPGAAPISSQPNWASSLGIKLAEEKRTEPAPEWMTKSGSTEQTPPVSSNSPEPLLNPPASEKSIPDWMSSASWQEAGAKTVEEPLESNVEPQSEPLAKADIPDWLQSMAPQEVAGAEIGDSNPESTNASLPGERDASDWLVKLGAATPAEIPDPVPSSGPSQGKGEIPDWIKEMSNSASAGTVEAVTAGDLEQPKDKSAPELMDSVSAPAPVESNEIPASMPAARSEEVSLGQPSGELTPLKIEDDAMAWLESLAAKQGAKEEELLTNPEDRSEEIPEWLLNSKEKPPLESLPDEAAAIPETQPLVPPTPIVGEGDSQESALHETLPLELPTQPAEGSAPDTTVVSEEPPPPAVPSESIPRPISVEDETKAWLDGLASKEDAKPMEVPVHTSGETNPTDDWIQKATPESTPLNESGFPEPSPDDITITSWLKKQDVEEALGKEKPSTPNSQPELAQTGDLPDWLKELEKPSPPKETEKPAEELPDWLRQATQSSEMGKTPAASVEPTPVSDLPEWKDETILESRPPAPTNPGEWIPVDEKPAQVPDVKPVPEPVSVPVAPPAQLRVLGGTGMLARIPAEDKDAEFLAAAQAALDANQLDETMRAYSKLIKKNRLLDEVIHDLREAIYRFPVDIIVWQTLGDAYMRANRLQDALDAYTKAEELLR